MYIHIVIIASIEVPQVVIGGSFSVPSISLVALEWRDVIRRRDTKDSADCDTTFCSFRTPYLRAMQGVMPSSIDLRPSCNALNPPPTKVPQKRHEHIPDWSGVPFTTPPPGMTASAALSGCDGLHVALMSLTIQPSQTRNHLHFRSVWLHMNIEEL